MWVPNQPKLSASNRSRRWRTFIGERCLGVTSLMAPRDFLFPFQVRRATLETGEDAIYHPVCPEMEDWPTSTLSLFVYRRLNSKEEKNIYISSTGLQRYSSSGQNRINAKMALHKYVGENPDRVENRIRKKKLWDQLAIDRSWDGIGVIHLGCCRRKKKSLYPKKKKMLHEEYIKCMQSFE